MPPATPWLPILLIDIWSKVKITNLKNLPKFQSLEFWKQHYTCHNFWCSLRYINMKWIHWVLMKCRVDTEGCQPVWNFSIFYMDFTCKVWECQFGLKIWKLSSVSSFTESTVRKQSLPVICWISVRICGILCLETPKYLFDHQSIQSSPFHMWQHVLFPQLSVPVVLKESTIYANWYH